MAHRFLLVHQMDKVKVAAAIAGSANADAGVHPHQAGRRPADRGPAPGGRRRPGHPRRPAPAARERALKDFADGRLPVLVATDVAARGIHVDGIDIVVHYDPPEDHKAYLHRSGARPGPARTAWS